jgi:hypothetical protein
VAVVLSLVGYPINLTDIELLGYGGSENYSYYGSDHGYTSYDGFDNSTYGYYGTDNSSYAPTDDYWNCGGTGDDCDYPYDDYESLHGIQGRTIDNLLIDLGFHGVVNQWLVELNCPVSDTSVAPPACAFNWGGDLGAWACRTMYNLLDGSQIQWNACVDPQKKGWNTDICGCCEGSCPAPCSCDCEVDDGYGVVTGVGSLLYYIPYDDPEEGPPVGFNVCIAKDIATSLVAEPGSVYTCAADCPVV